MLCYGEPFPAKSPVKGVLRRTVQLLKRDRDIAYQNEDPALKPLSIIITALASKAYEYCVLHYYYDNELDLLCDTIRGMPWFIETTVVGGDRHYLVWNETTIGENFAEKWNSDKRRAKHFYAWHQQALNHFEALKTLTGLDKVGRGLGEVLGNDPVNKAMRALSDEISEARTSNRLYIAPTVGLVTGLASGTRVQANTFFGR